MTRREYFSFPELTDQFDKAMKEFIGNLVSQERAKLISPENVMHYNHGTKWVTVSSSAPDEVGSMKTHSTETLIQMKDIREHNLTALPSFINNIVKQMDATIQQTLFETVSESSKRSGNSLSMNDYETKADAFLAMIKKIEFGVDREGNVSKPSLHMDPRDFDAIKKEADSQGDEFDKKVDEVIQQKSEAALDREKKRIARFKK
jgi:hypothetical protein